MSSSGNGHKQALHFTHPPERVVSLVPSLTESLFDLGFGASVVGVTDYCLHPAGGLTNLPRLGGTKNPRIDAILDLHPDLVLVNQEENPESVVNALEAAGLKVWVTFPKTVRQAMDILWVLVGIYQSRMAAARLEILEVTLDWAESSLSERQIWSYFCPIWYQSKGAAEEPGWWMTFNQDTYPNDVLRLMGGRNVFSGRVRRYPLHADLGMLPAEDPGSRDTRYPRISADEIQFTKPEVILLPSEPFPFGDAESQQIRALIPETPAVKEDRIYLLDGSLLTWHGTRLARALQELPAIFSEP
jgi:ABC-type Fe3+-hydroxamate transport system substrate-binding protein